MEELDADTLGGPSAATLIEPATGPASQPPAEHAATALRVGAGVGRYVVLDEIGQGGMGRVLRAYDPKLQREVALKEVRGDVLGRDGTARLVAEARAMAKLSHPNVVAVYDVESLESGRLVLVMEYVPGTTLRAWLGVQPREATVVIEHFVAAGRGLAAAHAAGLLHRDFKPANVLVGDGGLVKVTDFGLAKLDPGRDGSSSGAQEHLSDSGDLTRSGIVLGTPRYMAPEQHRGETLSAAADQYAFCIALWEALVGEAPFLAAPLLLRKQIGPPPWPAGDVVPTRIADAIRRGLCPRPEDRWPNVEALLAVLSARTATRRNRWLLGASLLGIGTAAIALRPWNAPASEERCTGAEQQLAGVWDETRRGEVSAAMLGVEAPYTARVWERTVTELDRYAHAWTEQHSEACAATTIRGEQSSAVMDLRMTCLQRARVDLEAVVGVLASADADVVANAHEVVEQLRPLQRCTDVAALQADVEPPAPEEADAVERIRVLVAQARAEEEAGRFDAARGKIDAAQRALAGVEYGPVHTEVLAQHGSILDRDGDYAGSEAALLQALELATTWRQWDDVRDIAAALLFVVGRQRQRMDEGLRYRELALGLAKGDLRAEMVARNNLAAVLHTQGKFADAEAQARRAIELAIALHGPDHHEVSEGRVNLAVSLQAQAHYDEAEAELRRALASFDAAHGPDHIWSANPRHNLGVVLEQQTRYEEAEAEHRRVLELRTVALGPEHPATAFSRTSLASALRKQGKNDEAEAEYRRSLELLEAALGPEHRDVLVARANLGAALMAQDRLEEAEKEHRRTLALYEKVMGPEHPEVAAEHTHLANVLHRQRRLDDAEVEYRRSLALLERALGAEHPSVALARSNLANLLLERDRPDEAVVLAELAWTRRQRDDVPGPQRATSAFVLAKALWAENKSSEQRDRARRLAEDAVATFRAAGPSFSDGADEVATWLASTD